MLADLQRWKQLAGIRPERARRPRPDWGSGLGRMGVFSTGVASGCTRLDATAMKPLCGRLGARKSATEHARFRRTTINRRKHGTHNTAYNSEAVGSRCRRSENRRPRCHSGHRTSARLCAGQDRALAALGRFRASLRPAAQGPDHGRMPKGDRYQARGRDHQRQRHPGASPNVCPAVWP